MSKEKAGPEGPVFRIESVQDENTLFHTLHGVDFVVKTVILGKNTLIYTLLSVDFAVYFLPCRSREPGSRHYPGKNTVLPAKMVQMGDINHGPQRLQ